MVVRDVITRAAKDMGSPKAPYMVRSRPRAKSSTVKCGETEKSVSSTEPGTSLAGLCWLSYVEDVPSTFQHGAIWCDDEQTGQSLWGTKEPGQVASEWCYLMYCRRWKIYPCRIPITAVRFLISSRRCPVKMRPLLFEIGGEQGLSDDG